MHVAEQFTGNAGVYIKREDTVRGFGMIVRGELDHIGEKHFFYKGTIDEVIASHEKSLSETKE